jgi:hypothetical protein
MPPAPRPPRCQAPKALLPPVETWAKSTWALPATYPVQAADLPPSRRSKPQVIRPALSAGARRSCATSSVRPATHHGAESKACVDPTPGFRASILVNNAGATQDALLLRLSEEELHRSLNVSTLLFAPLYQAHCTNVPTRSPPSVLTSAYVGFKNAHRSISWGRSCSPRASFVKCSSFRCGALRVMKRCMLCVRTRSNCRSCAISSA